jgi:Flp pilus assembly pilin Flp
MVEYALLVVLIAIVALVAVQIAGEEVSETFSEVSSGLDQ